MRKGYIKQYELQCKRMEALEKNNAILTGNKDEPSVWLPHFPNPAIVFHPNEVTKSVSRHKVHRSREISAYDRALKICECLLIYGE